MYYCWNVSSNRIRSPNNIGDTITDGRVFGLRLRQLTGAKINPSAIIELFELRLDSTLHGSSDVIRFHAGANANVDGNIVFNSQSYTRIPIKADGFEYTNTGTLPRPTLTISNLSKRYQHIVVASKCDNSRQ